MLQWQNYDLFATRQDWIVLQAANVSPMRRYCFIGFPWEGEQAGVRIAPDSFPPNPTSPTLFISLSSLGKQCSEHCCDTVLGATCEECLEVHMYSVGVSVTPRGLLLMPQRGVIRRMSFCGSTEALYQGSYRSPCYTPTTGGGMHVAESQWLRIGYPNHLAQRKQPHLWILLLFRDSHHPD